MKWTPSQRSAGDPKDGQLTPPVGRRECSAHGRDSTRPGRGRAVGPPARCRRCAPRGVRVADDGAERVDYEDEVQRLRTALAGTAFDEGGGSGQCRTGVRRDACGGFRPGAAPQSPRAAASSTPPMPWRGVTSGGVPLGRRRLWMRTPRAQASGRTRRGTSGARDRRRAGRRRRAPRRRVARGARPALPGQSP